MVGGVNLGDCMDQVANRLSTIAGLRVHAWPVTSVTPPTAVVLFPQNYTYDVTYGRGVDRMTLQVAVMVGRATERTTRDLLAKYLDGSGPSSVKAVLDSGTYGAFDSVRVTGVDVDIMTMNSVDFWGAVFDLDLIGPGS